MKGFTPGLFDRLLGTPVRGAAGGAAVSRISAEELKDAVARDLEALLNTRAVIDEALLQDYPECRSSILNYGLSDFADRSLSSPSDRAHICACLEKVITLHEPRLRNVKASLEIREGAVNRLNFSITALLVASSAQEPVNFDAVLQRSTLQYSISKGGRPASAISTPAGA
ncbi:type VI secretion protein [Massilia sp. WF1]|uniref:type VI secretion system baseplate subunit TssE n=1 Tax=unclassified Massilia TaxID=2609279 RepID=UPI00064AE3B7|nr:MULTISPECIES: type VI secretion system baseplate subunit TssE [unclassified Massilia]ALK95073.1 type VI secretion protein [Massilia sp. WG5]KLU35671.1 type VI secretion protein [Massilia sp. WF1]